MPRAIALWFIFIGCLISSCADKHESSAITSFHWQDNRYASWFKVSNENGYNIVVNYLNAAKSDSVIYVLYRETKPDLQLNAYYVKTPVKKVACLGSVFVGFLNRIGQIGAVTAVDNIDFISNAQVLYLNAEGSVKELAKNGQLNIEETLVNAPEVIFTNPGGDRKKDLDKRLVDAGIIPIVCGDYFENSPLARAEWVKFFGLFFNEKPKADSLFAETENRYAALKKMTDTCKYRPTVFTEVKTNDTWFVAGSKSSTAQFLNDAGANYLWRDNGKVEVTAMNMEQVIAKALGADYWINLHLCNSKEDLLKLDGRYAEFNAFKKGNLYNNNALLNVKGGNDFWEDGLCNPDEILSDLVEVFHPGLQPGKKLKYYKQLN
jgi:iron complex transport system substrate-binding protein